MARIYCMVKEGIHITQINSFFTKFCTTTYEFSGESHNFWESMYILKGSLCVTADDRVYQLSAGQCIFHQPLELHKFLVNDEEGALILVFSYTAEGTLKDFFREKVFTLNKEQRDILHKLYVFAETHAEENPSAYRRYHRAIKTVPFFPQRACLYIQQLMLSLAENNSEPPLIQMRDSENFTLAVRYMTERVTQNLTMGDIAKDLHFSVSSLKRIMRKYAGMGVHKYFLKLKIKAAIEMLENGTSVTAVARALNFSSQANFTNVFKRETGETPSSYRIKTFS